MDQDRTPGKAKAGSKRRGEARLGTDEASAAKIRDAIKASLARAHGEWVQLEEKEEVDAIGDAPPESTPIHTIETESPLSVDQDLDGGDERRTGEEQAVGRLLRGARERREITLEEASTDTRIARRYLEALEDGASAERFPSRAYARFFLRDYGRYLGLGDAELRDAYRGADESEELEPLSVSGLRPRRRWLTAVLVAAALVAVVVLGVTRIGAPQQEPMPSAPRSSPTAGVAAPPVALSPTPTPAPATEVVAVLRVSEASWVEAVADGETTLQELLVPGTVRRLKANEILELVLGNAGGVSLSINGKRVATGDPGEVARLSFELRNGHVVQQPT